jgi:hypothetical protein
VGGEREVLPDGLRLEQPLLDREPRLAECTEAAPVDDGIRVATGRDHTLDTRGDQSPSTRRRPAVMIAWLEGHERRRAGSSISREPQRHGFGVFRAGALVPPLAHHPPIAHEHAADQRIG